MKEPKKRKKKQVLYFSTAPGFHYVQFHLYCKFVVQFNFSCSVLWFGKVYMLLIGRMTEHSPLVEHRRCNNEMMNLLLLKSTCLSYPSFHWKTYPQLLQPISEITTPNRRPHVNVPPSLTLGTTFK